ncbi:MAG: NADH-quinone oxidoreductase subunit L [Bacteroidia bacterium]|nr:NADH-quinone oxidoreductase subunit L [Bacteroidia bacterium]
MVETLLPLAIGLPLIGASVIGLGALWVPALRLQRILLGSLATAFVAASASVFLLVFFNYSGPLIVSGIGDWIALEPLRIPIRYYVDSLSLWMALIITGIGALIHLYSIGYMQEEEGAWRYFAFLNLFIFAMLTLVLADSLPLLFLGWEGVGVCSYLLIGFWFKEEANARAAQKAFLVNRIGDVGLLLGMILLYAQTGTFDIQQLSQRIYAADFAIGVSLLLFLASTGKSAQLPLYVWLPDAMAGPTPVSALIHAATMVTAGLYLTARMDFLYSSAPEALLIVGGIGMLTALLGALVALTQYDIKKVLAYSTVSQLGFMFAAAGAGAYTVAIFHVFTHAFFKALLFLGSGSFIHATHTQDIREMGGLRRFMPISGITFWIGIVAIAGIPPLAGFFSKDEILAAVYARGAAGETMYYLYWAGLIGVAFLTAFYMGRLGWLTLEGAYRGKNTPHESPAVMTIPLVVLSVGSVGAGFVGLPPLLGTSWLREHWLASSVKDWTAPPIDHSTEIILMLGSITAGLVGLGLAYFIFHKGLAGEEIIREKLGSIHLHLSRQLGIETFYERVIIQGYYVIADFARVLYSSWVGRVLPQGIATLAAKLSQGFTRLQTGYLPNYLAYMIGLGLLIVWWLLLR